MPAPSSPPPSDEAGAILSPRQLNRWLDVNPVSALTRTQTYLTLPAFDAIFSQWKGYSELIGAFNFTAARNFTLPNYTTPTAPDYLLCISWFGLDGVVHRYKLWEDVGEVLYFDAPLYTGQLIKGNFRFEIWSVFDDNFESFGLLGAGEAGTNQLYDYFPSVPGVDLWVGVDRSVSNTVAFGTTYIAFNALNADIYYTVVGSLFGIWAITTGASPAPFGYTPNTALQQTSLTFYTSVRGNYDYYWQTDNALSAPSAPITDFNITDNDAPWTTPADSASTVNN